MPGKHVRKCFGVYQQPKLLARSAVVLLLFASSGITTLPLPSISRGIRSRIVSKTPQGTTLADRLVAFVRLPSRSGRQQLQSCVHVVESSTSCSSSTGDRIGYVHDRIGEYTLPRPWFFSELSPAQVWNELGVNVRGSSAVGDRYIVAPQPSYRPANDGDVAVLRSMRGEPINASSNPGIRVEEQFVSAEEETKLVDELQNMAKDYGFQYANIDDRSTHSDEKGHCEDAHLRSLRITGKDEKQPRNFFAPWGYASGFDLSRLPPMLKRVRGRIEEVSGQRLGPLRDVTVNMRYNDICNFMDPHIDPPPDGATSFVLSLLSGTVITFSPVEALRSNPARASDENMYARDSFTDEDLDCFAARRSLWHVSGDARYRWTHAIRPPFARFGDMGLEAFDRWGTWDKVLRREKDRISVIFAFADPILTDPADTS